MEKYTNKCDICGSKKDVVAGRWIFYCPKHKHIDWEKTYENEVGPDLASGNASFIMDDGDLQDMMLQNM